MIVIDDARALVLDAADDAFYRHGFHAVSMATIRDASGISLKRLYGLFPSKDALAATVLERRHEAWTADVQAAVDAVAVAADRPLAIYDFLEDWFATDSFRGCAFVNAFAELGTQAPWVAQLAREHKLRFQRLIARLVADAGLPEDLGPQLMLLAEGAQTLAAITREPETATHARAAAERLIRAAATERSTVGSTRRRG